ncbi:MAG: hypothetical protein WC624_01565 [Candidatus Margulisiibacteriota bacterium]
MKKAVILLIFFALISGIFAPVFAADPYSHQVKSLYSKPDGNSSIVYNLPIEVKMLDVSEDANWYKVKIQFNLGPICMKYSGWAYIPVGDILAEREANKAVAATSK